jgi:hypothetical protein
MASSIRSDSNSIPLQSPTSITSSRWSLDSEDIQRHAELQNILYPQTHPAARLSMKRSHHFPKSFAIGDAVHFQESMQPFTFLGYTGKVTYDKWNMRQNFGLITEQIPLRQSVLTSITKPQKTVFNPPLLRTTSTVSERDWARSEGVRSRPRSSAEVRVGRG